jgi:predicted Co/Zn/Cd cation transporter (cation efflux family)
MTRWRSLLVGVISLGAVVIAGTAGAVFNSIFGSCDPKFGCRGGVELAGFISAVAVMITAIASTTIVLTTRRRRQYRFRRELIAVGAAAVLLGACLPTYISVASFDSDWAMFLSWFLLSGVVTAMTLRISDLTRPDRSRERSREP